MTRYYTKKRPPPTYTLEDIAKAVESVKNTGLTFRAAALAFGVPKSVLYNRIHGRKTPLDSIGQGRKLVFSVEAEREIIERFLKYRSEGHVGNKKEFLDTVVGYIEEHKLKNPFINNRPGEEWYRRFLKRHPTLFIEKSNNCLEQSQSSTDSDKKLFDTDHDLDEEASSKAYANESCVYGNPGSSIQWPTEQKEEILIKEEETDGASVFNRDAEIKVEDLDVSTLTKTVFEITEFEDSGAKVSKVMCMLPEERSGT